MRERFVWERDMPWNATHSMKKDEEAQSDFVAYCASSRELIQVGTQRWPRRVAATAAYMSHHKSRIKNTSTYSPLKGNQFQL